MTQDSVKQRKPNAAEKVSLEGVAPKAAPEKSEINKKPKQNKQEKTESRSLGTKLHDFALSMFDPVDNTTLIFFRILWGVIMAYEASTFIVRDYNKLESYYLRSTFYFKYPGFYWVHALPGNGMYIFIWVMALAGVFVAIGFLYRIATVTWFIGFTYIILLDSSLYLNHFYLVSMMSFLLVVFPANQDLAVDAWLNPKIRSTTMPRWVLWLLRGEQVLVYFYAGVAKINEDWLRAEPLRHWLLTKPPGPNASAFVLFLDKVNQSRWAPYFFSYSGLIFDLFAGFGLLLSGPIFYASLASCVFFHTMNRILFSIGIFPYVMLISTALFFDPGCFRKVVPWLFTKKPDAPAAPATPSVSSDGEASVPPPENAEVASVTPKKNTPRKRRSLTTSEKIVLVFLVGFTLHQVLMPLRHHLYPGDVAWNEMGHMYSWRMKLRDKRCDLIMGVTDRLTNQTMEVDVGRFLYGKQYRKMKPRPDLVLQFAHHLSDTLYTTHPFSKADRPPKVIAELWCSLNYRRWQPMIKSDIDLTEVQPFDYPYPENFLVPLQPLTPQEREQFPWNWEWNFNWLDDFMAPAEFDDPETYFRQETGPFERAIMNQRAREQANKYRNN